MPHHLHLHAMPHHNLSINPTGRNSCANVPPSVSDFPLSPHQHFLSTTGLPTTTTMLPPLHHQPLYQTQTPFHISSTEYHLLRKKLPLFIPTPYKSKLYQFKTPKPNINTQKQPIYYFQKQNHYTRPPNHHDKPLYTLTLSLFCSVFCPVYFFDFICLPISSAHMKMIVFYNALFVVVMLLIAIFP